MVLRLVLVSLVAGLGVSPSAERELADWTQAVQIWLDARLADWKTREPLAERAIAPGAGAPVVDLGIEVEDDAWMDEDSLEVVTDKTAPVETTNVVSDSGFEAVVEEMVVEFCRDAANGRA